MVSRMDLLEEGRLDSRGNEIPDPNPVSIPAGFKRPETLSEQVARLVRRDLALRSAQAERDGNETFEESEDFDIDDDTFDPHSPYEEVFDPVLGRGITHAEFKANEAVYRERFLKAEKEAWEAMDRSEALRARPRPGKPSGPPEAAPQPSKPDGK